MSKNPHEHDLELVAAGLAHLLPHVVFVGGATVGFYITDAGAPTVRGTDDIDCIIELHSRTAYQQLNADLIQLGFRNDTSVGAPICRYRYQSYVVDIMPTDEEALGFTNRWYAQGITKPEKVTLKSGKIIHILSIPYFIACKFEAYTSRGESDFIGSRDIQDIVAILDGHLGIEDKLSYATSDVGNYLQNSFRTIFDVDQEELQAHLSGDYKSQRTDKIQKMIAHLYGPL